MRKVLSALGLLLCIAALLCLSGCGAAPEEAGRYLCVQALDGELTLETPESVLLLDRGGKARLELGAEGGAASWTLEAGELRLHVDGAELRGTLEDGVLSLVSEDGLRFVYVREELAEAYRAALAEEQARREELELAWLGDWYGFWSLESEEGSLESAWYDCCARVRALSGGGLSLLLWDEDSEAEKPLAALRLLAEEEGLARAVDGWFWFASGVDCLTSLRLEEGCIRCEGLHEAGGERFSFTITLRRWGDEWPESAQRPYYYEDWYLPLLRAGEPMPDRMPLSK